MNNTIYSILQMNNVGLIYLVFVILGGLGIFLYGMNLMSESLKSIGGNGLKNIVSKATSNIFKGFLVGIIITCLLQSSSASTVIVVGLIAAGLIDLKHALPIIIGSRIGTTILAYIVGLNISFICFPIIFIGAMIILFISKRKFNLSGRIILGFGLLFLGLELMSISFGSFKNMNWFKELMTTLGDNSMLSFIVGLGLTALIQSSGAFIGIVQEIYVVTDTMILKIALALVIGSNIGTTITAFIASLSGNRVSKQAALSNTLIVVVGAIIFLPLLSLMVKLFDNIETSMFGNKNMFTIAFFHTFFNITVCFIALPLTSLICKIVEVLIPIKDKKEHISAEVLNKELLKTPSIALESAKRAMIEMNDFVKEMHDLSVKYFNENNHKYVDKINELEEKVDLAEHLIHDYLMQISEAHLNQTDAYRQTLYIDVIRDFERIADHSTNFSEFIERYYSVGKLMSDEMHDALLTFFNVITEQIYDSIEAFKYCDKEISRRVIEREQKVDCMEEEYRLKVHSYITPGDVNNLDILYIDIVSNLERISDHTTNICELIIDPHMASPLIVVE